MKFIRYAIIALLLYSLGATLYGYIAPSVTFGSGTDTNVLLESSAYKEGMVSYKAITAQWAVLISLILAGWILSRKKWVVYLVSPTALVLLGHLIFVNIRKLGYTLDQSISTLLEGHNHSFIGWSLFYFIAIIILLASVQKGSSSGTHTTL